jgi:HEAT repeat protein
MGTDLNRLIKALRSGDAASRQTAAEELSGSPQQGAAVALVEACGADDDSLESVTAALEELGPPAASDSAPLAKLLDSPLLDVAYWAATLLGRAGAGAASAVPQLTQALGTHAELAVRERAAWALAEIGSGAGTARPALEKAAAGSDRRLAKLAREALAKLPC